MHRLEEPRIYLRLLRQINNVRPCPVNVNLRKKMHLVSRGAATTPNISASDLYTRPYRVFTAVGGVSKGGSQSLHHHGDNSHGDNTTCLSLGTRENMAYPHARGPRRLRRR